MVSPSVATQVEGEAHVTSARPADALGSVSVAQVAPPSVVAMIVPASVGPMAVQSAGEEHETPTSWETPEGRVAVAQLFPPSEEVTTVSPPTATHAVVEGQETLARLPWLGRVPFVHVAPPSDVTMTASPVLVPVPTATQSAAEEQEAPSREVITLA
jgi:hypothetical protein